MNQPIINIYGGAVYNINGKTAHYPYGCGRKECPNCHRRKLNKKERKMIPDDLSIPDNEYVILTVVSKYKLCTWNEVKEKITRYVDRQFLNFTNNIRNKYYSEEHRKQFYFLSSLHIKEINGQVFPHRHILYIFPKNGYIPSEKSIRSSFGEDVFYEFHTEHLTEVYKNKVSYFIRDHFHSLSPDGFKHYLVHLKNKQIVRSSDNFKLFLSKFSSLVERVKKKIGMFTTNSLYKKIITYFQPSLFFFNTT